ncbi:hypothetical protein GBAR_LOCUS13698, partial [Geodia barretti]
FPPAGCRAPPSPVNGSIEEYRSTEEGAEIQFHCHDGYTPNEWMSSQCLNSSWSPQPTDLVCVLPDPDTHVLPDPDNVTPDPDNVTPDPNITCEAPINTSTTFFKSEGSSVMIFCEDGYFIDGSVTSTCVSNGSWVPDLLRIQCEPGNHGSTSAKKGRELVIVGASSAVSLLFLFIVGVAVVFCCCRRKIGSRVKRKKRTVANEYTEMLATSPPPSGTAGGRTTTPFTYHEQIQDPATNDCPPAPGLQASPLSVHTSERGTRLSLQTRVSRGNPSTSTSIQRIISRTSLLSFYTPSRESQLPRVYCLRSYRWWVESLLRTASLSLAPYKGLLPIYP